MEGKRYCSECGAENNVDSLFCENCGMSFEEEEEELRGESKEQVSYVPDDNEIEGYTAEESDKDEVEVIPQSIAYDSEPVKERKSFKILIIILIIAAVAGAGVFVYFHFFQKTKVDLTKDLDVDILRLYGYNGEGYIGEIDMDMVMEKWNKNNRDENVQMFLETCEVTTDKMEDGYLSNGDPVKIIVKYKKAYAKEFKIEVVGEEKTVRIKGLEEEPVEDEPEDIDYDTSEESYDEEEDESDTPQYSVEPFEVKVDVKDLNIREGPGTDYDKTGKSTGKGTFTIVEVQDGKGSDSGWGLLDSGEGWISLDFVEF